MTILEIIQRSTEFLGKRGVESPRLQVELLLAHALKLPRMKLYLAFERQLTPPETDLMRDLVRRRAQREPLQYITGSVSFCGLELAVNQNVLIPRPETEQLAERAWQQLSRLTGDQPLALDLCTGSGCLAIALAINAPKGNLVATDISPEALRVASENAARHQLSARITFQLSDGFAGLPKENPFDLIVSNPPYIPTPDLAELEPEVRDFEPPLALDGGADGLDFYRRIAQEARAFLKPSGTVMLELNDNGGEPVEKIFGEAGWQSMSVHADFQRKQRIFIAQNHAG